MKQFWNTLKSNFSKKYLYLGGGILVFSFAYTNCSKINVSEIAPVDAVGALGSPTNTSVLLDAPTLKATCADAKSTGKLRTAQLTASFADPKKACDWDVNGNISMAEAVITARHEQRQVFHAANISDGKVAICNIKMASPSNTQFYYDDNLFVTLNGYVLASTSNFTRHLESAGEFFRYDWSRLVGKPAQNSAADSAPNNQYCAGASTGEASCEFPQTEVIGASKLQFSESVIQNILGMTNSSQFELGVITTGDNDPAIDCQHVAIDLNLDVEYVVQ